MSPRRPTLLASLLSIGCMVAITTMPFLLGGCGEGSSNVTGVATPRPAPPEAIDPVARAIIEIRAAKVAENPTSRATWMAYGDACLANLWPEEAAIAYEESLQDTASLDPVLAAKVRWRLARALHDAGQADAADAEAVAALAAIPDFKDGWVTLASWRLDRGELDAADEALAKAESAPPMRRAMVSVQLDLQQGRTDAARATVDDLLTRGVQDRTINRLAVALRATTRSWRRTKRTPPSRFRCRKTRSSPNSRRSPVSSAPTFSAASRCVKPSFAASFRRRRRSNRSRPTCSSDLGSPCFA
jgi:hypothetical protein